MWEEGKCEKCRGGWITSLSAAAGSGTMSGTGTATVRQSIAGATTAAEIRDSSTRQALIRLKRIYNF
jgi:hypothetical protein